MAAGRQPGALSARGRFWQRHLQRWKQSGLSQVQYCRRHHLSAPALGWWKRRLATTGGSSQPAAKARTAAGKKSSFVELTLGGREAPAPADAVVYEIVLPGSRRLRLGCGFEPERVRQLLAALEGAC